MHALRSNSLPAPGFRLQAPGYGLKASSPKYFRFKCVDSSHFAFKYIHATSRRTGRYRPGPPPKSQLQVVCLQEDATVQNNPPGSPADATTCHSPKPRGEGGPVNSKVPDRACCERCGSQRRQRVDGVVVEPAAAFRQRAEKTIDQ